VKFRNSKLLVELINRRIMIVI